MAAYADADDLVVYYDSRTIKDLLSDTGEPVGSLANNNKLTAILSAASGLIDSALRVGGLYDPDDLDALSDESQDLLKMYTCQIAMAKLILRRPEKWKAANDFQQDIDQILDMFRSGARVFEIDNNIAAGRPTIDGLRQADYTRLNMIPDRTRNFYPSRKQSLPIGR